MHLERHRRDADGVTVGMRRQRAARALDRHPAPTLGVDARLTARSPSRDGHEVGQYLPAGHAVKDDDIQEAVGGIGVRGDREPGAMVRAVADDDRREIGRASCRERV